MKGSPDMYLCFARCGDFCYKPVVRTVEVLTPLRALPAFEAPVRMFFLAAENFWREKFHVKRSHAG